MILWKPELTIAITNFRGMQMIHDHRCFFCFVRAFEKLVEKENISAEAKNRFVYNMVSLYHDNWNRMNAPEFAREIHNALKKETGNNDPYKSEKRENNNEAIRLIPELMELVRNSRDPFNTALRLSIAGNIIDFAAGSSFDLQGTIARSLNSEFATDHSEQLKKAVENSGSVLFLGDNAGEIVFDKLFIETINHKNLTYVVRGAPVINDATMEDAEYTGINRVARVISNEYDAPSTVIEKSGKLFRTYFKKADVIISKGQGNLEGMVHLNDDRIYFLLMVKCQVMADFLKVEKGSFVVYNACL